MEVPSMKLFHTKKFRYGSVSLALTIVIIAAVILVNAIFTALSEKFVWYVDMTADQVYSLSDEAKELLDKEMDPSRKVTIIFCMPKDELEAEATLRYPLYTVMEMAQEYDNIDVKYVDCLTNPSAVSQYKETSGQAINSFSIIVTSTFDAADPVTNEVKPRTQSRVYSLSALYTYDSTGDTIIGYNGEQRLVSAVLAVTQVEVPLACYTANHGEKDSLVTTNGSPLLTLLYETGYDVKDIDLTKEDIPDNCSLLLIFNPTSDFIVADSMGGVNEIAKLDTYLQKSRGLMVFLNHETPAMPNLDPFLKDWGVEVARTTDSENAYNYLVKDQSNSFDPNGIINVGQYAETGLGASLTRDLLKATHPKSVVFKYATALKLSSTYQTLYDDENKCYYGAYYSNGIERDCYDVFTSGKDSFAEANGSKAENGPFKYMTVTREEQVNPETGKTVYAYVMVCSSTDFASMDALASGYGNHTVLARACQVLGGAQVSVSLACKYFTDTTIDSITSKEANQYTIVLTVVPAAIIFIAGVYIMVRRKYA